MTTRKLRSTSSVSPEAVLTSESRTEYVLQAALDETPDAWYTLEGFSYPTEAELDEVYEKWFRRIEGKGCRYRRVRVERSKTVTLLSR